MNPFQRSSRILRPADARLMLLRLLGRGRILPQLGDGVQAPRLLSPVYATFAGFICTMPFINWQWLKDNYGFEIPYITDMMTRHTSSNHSIEVGQINNFNDSEINFIKSPSVSKSFYRQFAGGRVLSACDYAREERGHPQVYDGGGGEEKGQRRNGF